MRRPHTTGPRRRFSPRRICHETSEIVSKIHNEAMHEESRGFTAFSSGDSSMRLSWARTIARVARPPVLTTCSLIVDAARRTNVSAARFWLRDMSQLLNIVARALPRSYRAIQAPWLSHDTVPFYAGPRSEIQLKSRYDLLWLHKNVLSSFRAIFLANVCTSTPVRNSWSRY